jgi:hypothetical protein
VKRVHYKKKIRLSDKEIKDQGKLDTWNVYLRVATRTNQTIWLC